MKLQSFDSMEALMAHVAEARDAADQCVLPFQAEAKYGDCYLRLVFDQGLVIYGELLDPIVLDRPQNRQPSEEEQAELDYTRDLYAQPHMQHYRFGRHYSVCCEDGELGDVHVSSIAAIISREAFEAARALGWPEGVVGAAWNQSRKQPDPISAFKAAVEAGLLKLRAQQQSFKRRSS